MELQLLQDRVCVVLRVWGEGTLARWGQEGHPAEHRTRAACSGRASVHACRTASTPDLSGQKER